MFKKSKNTNKLHNLKLFILVKEYNFDILYLWKIKIVNGQFTIKRFKRFVSFVNCYKVIIVITFSCLFKEEKTKNKS